MHVYHYGESYGRAISSDFGLTVFPVQRQLDKFEKAGVLVRKKQGKTVVFTWNAKPRFAKRMKTLVEVVYQEMSLDEREARFRPKTFCQVSLQDTSNIRFYQPRSMRQ
jgi:hypothetical protein